MKTLTLPLERRSKTHSLVAQWITTLFIATTFYSYGTAMMDYFLLYPTRALVGEAEFAAFHTKLGELILPISVFPFLLLTILNVLLFWWRPESIPRGLVWASFMCLLLDWLSTVFIQIPLNLQLNEGRDEAVMEQVWNTNWIRVVLETSQALLAFQMLWLLISAKK